MTQQQLASIPAIKLRLAAIDLDGTLLGPDLKISAENRRAVAKLQAAGMEIVLASGRHHDSIRPYAAELSARWIVSAQGGEVSDITRKTVLIREFLPRDGVESVLALRQELGITSLFYTTDEILIDIPANEDVEFYTRLSGLHPARVATTELPRSTIYKIIWIGTPDAIAVVSTDARVAALDVQKVRTHLRIFELMPKNVSKATGLAVLARHLGIAASEAVAFGDADNDIPMFKWAAASFAMAHGWAAAKQSARWVAPVGAPESAFARAVDQLGLVGD